MDATAFRRKDSREGAPARDSKSRRATPSYVCSRPWDVALTVTLRMVHVLNGFLPRFVFATGAAVPRPVGIETMQMIKARNTLVDRAREFHTYAATVDLVTPCEAVLDAQWALEQDFGHRADQSARPAAAAPALKRLGDAVLRTAALLALDRCQRKKLKRVEITLEDFEAARAMGARWLPSTLAVIEDLGATEFQRNADAIAASIQVSGGISLSDLYRKHRGLRRGILTSCGALLRHKTGFDGSNWKDRQTAGADRLRCSIPGDDGFTFRSFPKVSSMCSNPDVCSEEGMERTEEKNKVEAMQGDSPQR